MFFMLWLTLNALISDLTTVNIAQRHYNTGPASDVSLQQIMMVAK
jgi:hypothetical protein